MVLEQSVFGLGSLPCSSRLRIHPAIQFVAKLLCFEVGNIVFIGSDKPIPVIINNHLPKAGIRHSVGRIAWHSFYFSVEHRVTYDTTFQRLYKRTFVVPEFKIYGTRN